MLDNTILEKLYNSSGDYRGMIVESIGNLYYIPRTPGRSNQYVIKVKQTVNVGFEFGTFVSGFNNIYILDYASKITVPI